VGGCGREQWMASDASDLVRINGGDIKGKKGSVERRPKVRVQSQCSAVLLP
jgi:hypothetical protein